jgi:hypothetical protein
MPSTKPMLSRVARVASTTVVAAVCALSIANCAAELNSPAVAGYPTAYADDVPPDVYAYPHASFSGGYAYLVGDSWVYPTGGRWVRLRREPPELGRYRADYARPRWGGGPAPTPEPRRAAPPPSRSVPAGPIGPGPRGAAPGRPR